MFVSFTAYASAVFIASSGFVAALSVKVWLTSTTGVKLRSSISLRQLVCTLTTELF